MIKGIVLVISLMVSLMMFGLVFFSKQMFKDTRKEKVPVRIRSDRSRK